MQFTITSLVLTALATLASTAAVPSTAASTALPPKFSLTWSPVSDAHTAFDKMTRKLTMDTYFPNTFTIGTHPRSFSTQMDSVVYTNATTNSQYINMIDGLNSFIGKMSFNTVKGFQFDYSESIDADDHLPVDTGFSQIGGHLAYDAKDGKGPTTASWDLCGFTDNSEFLEISWNRVYDGGNNWPFLCIPVNINVVAM